MKYKKAIRIVSQKMRKILPLCLMIVILIVFAAFSYIESRPQAQELEQLSQKLLENLNQHPQNTQHAYIMVALEQVWAEDRKHEFWQHLWEAFVIALIVLLTVELHTHRILGNEISEKVGRHFDQLHGEAQAMADKTWEGVGRRLLGENISQQLDEILKVNTAKEESQYNITFEEIIEEKGHSWAVVSTQNWFTLRNLTGTSNETFALTTNLIGTREIGAYPYFTSVEVNGVSITLDPKNKKSLAHTIQLPPNREEKTRVSLSYKAVYRLTDHETFITSRVPIEELSIIVSNHVPDVIRQVNVEVMHPHFPSVRRTSPVSWRFERALLPGQGFALIWNEKGQEKEIETENELAAIKAEESKKTEIKDKNSPVSGGISN